jgi:hypothetical protein
LLPPIQSAALAAPHASVQNHVYSFATARCKYIIDSNGRLTGIVSRESGKNYVAVGQESPLLSLKVNGKLINPTAFQFDARTRIAELTFDGGKASISVRVCGDYLRLELLSTSTQMPVELVLWGPYPTAIGETIGDTVGVVRDREFAVGIQALNTKTLGGFPTHESDIEAETSGDDHGFYPDLPSELLKGQGYRSDAAVPEVYGSSLRAFTRNRNTVRNINNWGHDQFLAQPYADGGVNGSAIALFGVPSADALSTIGKIELKEGLPHPMLDGKWAKISPTATASYLIVDFSEKTIDDAILMTKQAGLKFLYHSSPFETWGHFELKKSLFPHGWEGYRACAAKAKKAGIRLGFHTLSNFITPNDAYVSPKPDARLAKIGSAKLSAALDDHSTEIEVDSAVFFQKHTTLNTVQIGDELISYEKVTGNAPYVLSGCKRGAWGTRVSQHAAGDAISKLMDHDYRTFLGDASLSQEIAKRVANFCNTTGARQLSFDGLEGNWASGYGQYGRTLFTDAWYRSLNKEIKGGVINDASNPGHYNWHIATRMNWGEPWYAGFRESQTLYRFKNQVYFERNLMPHMLGWFALSQSTTVEDAEWLLARASGFKAGFALAASLGSTAQLTADPSSADTSRKYGALPAILKTIGAWETARRLDVFSPEVRAALRDNSREFHLEPIVGEPMHWNLYEMYRAHTPIAKGDLQPVLLPQAGIHGPLTWVFSVSSGKLTRLKIVMKEGRALDIDLADSAVDAGGIVRCSGDHYLHILDAEQREIRRIAIKAEDFTLHDGDNWMAAADAPGRMEVSVQGDAIPVAARAGDDG